MTRVLATRAFKRTFARTALFAPVLCGSVLCGAVMLAAPTHAASHASDGTMGEAMGGMDHSSMHGAKADAALATGEAVQASDLTLQGAWTRQTPPGARAGGGYLTITNTGTQADRLLGGTASFAEAVEIHSMSVQDGIMRMEEIEGGLEIAPGETAQLKPGGNHVMMIGLQPGALTEGDTATLLLRFERAGAVEVQMPVAAIGARGPNVEAMPKMTDGADMDGMSDAATE